MSIDSKIDNLIWRPTQVKMNEYVNAIIEKEIWNDLGRKIWRLTEIQIKMNISSHIKNNII